MELNTNIFTMLKFITYLLTIITAVSCSTKDNVHNFIFPEIKDTSKISEYYFSPVSMQHSKNEVRTLQKIGETANLNSSYKKFNYFSESSNDLIERKNLKKYSFNGFSIYVDTLNELSMESSNNEYPFLLFWEDKKKNNKKRIEDSIRQKIEIENWQKNKKHVKALPIYIVNHTKKSIIISEQETELILIQEALDKNGNWKPIDYMTFSYCGNSYGEYILRPNYYLMSKIYKYKGNFETFLRVKMASDTSITYSRPFRGSINLSQFNVSKNVHGPHNFLVRKK